jgi:DNA-directed RNA polymerase sigma subunit (sigma70/sigma32)
MVRGRPKKPPLSEVDRISKERVRQIQERALGKLRRLMFERGYKAEDFFDTTKQRRG